jgi:hypothetical protein
MPSMRKVRTTCIFEETGHAPVQLPAKEVTCNMGDHHIAMQFHINDKRLWLLMPGHSLIYESEAKCELPFSIWLKSDTAHSMVNGKKVPFAPDMERTIVRFSPELGDNMQIHIVQGISLGMLDERVPNFTRLKNLLITIQPFEE